MSKIYAYVIDYSDGTEDVLRTSRVPFTLDDLKAAGGTHRYEYMDHEGNRWEAVVDTNKVVGLREVEEPPGPVPPTM